MWTGIQILTTLVRGKQSRPVNNLHLFSDIVSVFNCGILQQLYMVEVSMFCWVEFMHPTGLHIWGCTEHSRAAACGWGFGGGGPVCCIRWCQFCLCKVHCSSSLPTCRLDWLRRRPYITFSFHLPDYRVIVTLVLSVSAPFLLLDCAQF